MLAVFEQHFLDELVANAIEGGHDDLCVSELLVDGEWSGVE